MEAENGGVDWQKCVDERRIGRFQMDRDIVMGHPVLAHRILASVIVVSCDLNFATDGFKYQAIGPDFEPTKRGVDLPVYDVQVTMEEGKDETAEPHFVLATTS